MPTQAKSGRELTFGQASSKGVGGELQPDGLTQRVGRIRTALGIDVGISLPEALRLANEAMGFTADGRHLPAQADRLVAALGLH